MTTLSRIRTPAQAAARRLLGRAGLICVGLVMVFWLAAFFLALAGFQFSPLELVAAGVAAVALPIAGMIFCRLACGLGGDPALLMAWTVGCQPLLARLSAQSRSHFRPPRALD